MKNALKIFIKYDRVTKRVLEAAETLESISDLSEMEHVNCYNKLEDFRQQLLDYNYTEQEVYVRERRTLDFSKSALMSPDTQRIISKRSERGCDDCTHDHVTLEG